ncbi:MAG: sel1 repeat family protein [Rhodospirillales bacterium]|nr:sel1 repeat family protein [Rhodospirillales bacterium]
MEILTATAEKGYLASQILLAEFHWRFTSPQRDREKSFKWYLRAAENGDFPSLALAAGMLIEGLGVAKDPGRALRMLEKGAAEGNLWAHASLGNLLRSGRYVPRDEDRAYLHLRLAADNFNTTAMFPLGLFLIKTSGKYRNVARGVELLEAAARRGSFAAPFFLGDLYREGKHLPKDDEKMTFWFCRIGQEGKKILEEHFGHEPECDE